uniref:Uncharacterized protein n=1 Tax=Rhizophora mucronata TaxID=61149 RepID=A0A2P2NCP4_RHIMU
MVCRILELIGAICNLHLYPGTYWSNLCFV